MEPNLINDSKCCVILFGGVFENIDSFKLVYIYIDINSIGLALKE